MSLTTATGTALILSTLIYHGGLAYLFARAEFGDVLPLPRGEKLLIIARHPDAYRWGCRIILAGWIVGAVASVMFAGLLRDAGDPIISTVAAALFLMAIASAVVFWVFHVAPTLSAAKEWTARRRWRRTTRSSRSRRNPHWGSINSSGCWQRQDSDGRYSRRACCRVGLDG